MPPRSEPISLTLVVERKRPSLPRYVVVLAAAIARWNLTISTLVDVSIEGRSAGQRTIKRWDEARWFPDITQPDCEKGHFDVGDAKLSATKSARARRALGLDRAAS